MIYGESDPSMEPLRTAKSGATSRTLGKRSSGEADASRTGTTDLLLTLDGVGPAYRQIYRSLRSAILSGKLSVGSRFPATRTIAKQLGVSRNIVLMAYRHLLIEGYASARMGSGTYVSHEISRAEPSPSKLGNTWTGASIAPRLSAYATRLATQTLFTQAATGPQAAMEYDFRYGVPMTDAFPLNVWARLVAAQARRTSASSLGYGPPEGQAPLREAIAHYLCRSRAAYCDPDQVIVVNGSQQAFDLVARVLINPRDRVVIEEPQYPGAREAFLGVGARLVSVPVDHEGLDVAKLGRATHSARLVSVTPSHQFPTGAIMSLARRLALLRWAEERAAYVVEDDYESEYRYEHRPVEAIQGLDRAGRVIYIGTFSKVLFPALRLGYLVLPRPLVQPFRSAKWLADRHTASFPQGILTRFIREGHFERHLRRARALLASRRAALLGAIRTHLGNKVEVSGASAGLHILMWIREMQPGAALTALIGKAAKAGVGIYPVTPYYMRPPQRAGLLLGYAGLNEGQIRAGIERLSGELP
jgi:GntR family transcriptional regulator/MocR family aminotransferase